MRAVLAVLLAAMALPALAACRTDVVEALPTYDLSALRVVESAPIAPEADGTVRDALLVVGGPWRREFAPWRVDAPERERGGAVAVAAAEVDDEDPVAARREAAFERLAERGRREGRLRPPLPDPPPLPRSAAPDPRPPTARARTHLPDHPSRLRATSIVLYVPADLAAEVRLDGDHVADLGPAGRSARGSARARLRHFAIEGDRIQVRVPDDPDAPLQVTARGEVDFVLRVGDRVHREEGLRALLVTNDNVVPLP